MPKNDNKPRCLATTAAGTPCRAAPGPSGYCYMHDPERAAERQEARASGGAKAGITKAARALAADRPAFKVDGPGDIVDMLKAVANEVYDTPTTARFDVSKKARAIATVLSVLLKAYELTDLEARLAVLENEREATWT
jgi:hypothetical protein